MEKIYITVAGLAQMKIDLEHFKMIERPAIIEAIAEARAHGDLSENAEYHSAKEKQGFIEAKIKDLDAKISLSHAVDPERINETKVVFGATVEVVDVDTEEEITFAIVGQDEADIDKGLISISSPIARALIGKFEGDEASFTTPKGQRTFEIESIKYIKINK